MLSYRHAFHAGNHADVLKHFLLVQLARYLGQKDKPFWYIDTHAGAGLYALDTGYATKLAEYEKGIGRLWSRDDLPAALAEYVTLVRALNPAGKLQTYPGSPWLAHQTLRTQDRLCLFELHSRDSELLQENFHAAGARVAIHATDGFVGIRALLPPGPRRALVLIDPSYEDKRDYRLVAQTIEEALRRYPDTRQLVLVLSAVNQVDSTAMLALAELNRALGFRQIKMHLPTTRIVALSMFEEAGMSRKMRKAGAEVYLLKTSPSEELLAAIRGKRPGR